MGARRLHRLTLVAALGPSYEIFPAARILAGMGIGAESVIVAPYLSQFVLPARRGWFVGGLAEFFSFGYVAAAPLGRFVVPTTGTGWRWAQVVTAIPVVLLLSWRRSLLGSPRGQGPAGHRTGAAPVRDDGDDADLMAHRAGLLTAVRFPWGRSMRRRTAVVWLIWFVNIVAFYGFFTWIPTLLIPRASP